MSKQPFTLEMTREQAEKLKDLLENSTHIKEEEKIKYSVLRKMLSRAGITGVDVPFIGVNAKDLYDMINYALNQNEEEEKEDESEEIEEDIKEKKGRKNSKKESSPKNRKMKQKEEEISKTKGKNKENDKIKENSTEKKSYKNKEKINQKEKESSESENDSKKEDEDEKDEPEKMLNIDLDEEQAEVVKQELDQLGLEGSDTIKPRNIKRIFKKAGLGDVDIPNDAEIEIQMLYDTIALVKGDPSEKNDSRTKKKENKNEDSDNPLSDKKSSNKIKKNSNTKNKKEEDSEEEELEDEVKEPNKNKKNVSYKKKYVSNKTESSRESKHSIKDEGDNSKEEGSSRENKNRSFLRGSNKSSRENDSSIRAKKLGSYKSERNEEDFNPYTYAHSFKISEDQVKNLKTAFDEFKKNSSGQIDVEDFRDSLKAALEAGGKEYTIKSILDELDNHNNTTLDFDEFIYLMVGSDDYDVSSKKGLKEIFKLFDLDEDGLISVNDLTQISELLDDDTDIKDIERMIQTADLNGDGKVDMDDLYYIITVEPIQLKLRKLWMNNKDT